MFSRQDVVVIGEVFDVGVLKLVKVRELETLDISRTNFSWSAISSLSTAVKSSSLRNLNLASLTGLETLGPLPAQELSAFENLERLDLSDNSLTVDGLTPKELHGLSKLSMLKHLDLSANNFGKQILRVLDALPALKSLNLRYNEIGIEGPLSIKDLANLSRLEILDMGANCLNGSISPYIEALSSAKAISLSINNFNGDFPSQDLCRFKKLEEFDISYNDFEASLNPTTIEYIDLSHNLFEGLFSFSSFTNPSKLKVVRIMSDNSKLVIETENPVGWTPLFQLTALVLQNCNLNKLTGNIPKFLFDHTDWKKLISLTTS
ncbi:hypothetical protein I3760_07G043700 [Carya illinoinensis]|nr:hypothetical protein I3760_07G043700 [Carya illinoinensis]